MGSLTRRMRKRQPSRDRSSLNGLAASYGVKRLPAPPATIVAPREQVFDPGSVEVFVGGHRLKPADALAVAIESGSGTPIMIVEAGPATLSKAETFHPGPPNPVLPAREPNPLGRRSPLQTILLMGMMAGLATDSGRRR
jgi:hypothetical protein